MRHFLFSISLLFFSTAAAGAHIIGGIVSYEVQSMTADTTTLSVNFKMYRDVNGEGAQFDHPSNVEFGVYRKIGADEYVVFDVLRNSELVKRATTPNPLNPDLEIEIGNYYFRLALPKGGDYLIAYQRCCRSSTITNIAEPGDTGFALQIEIFSAALESNLPSPYLSELPLTIAPLSHHFEFTLPLVADSSLVTEMYLADFYTSGGVFDNTAPSALGCCECLRPLSENCTAPFAAAELLNPYSATDPFGPENSLAFGPAGTFSGTMNIAGSYQYGVEISSYHNAVLFSRQTLDYNLTTALLSEVKNINHDDITVFPNPTRDYLTIRTPTNTKLDYMLYNLDGKKLQESSASSQKIMLRVGAGIYLLKVVDSVSGQSITKKVVKLD